MRNFPTHPVLFPQNSDDFFGRLNRKVGDIALKRFENAARASGGELGAWLVSIAAKHRSVVRAACLNPAALAILFSRDVEQYPHAIASILGGLSHVPRPSTMPPTRLSGLSKWNEPLRGLGVRFVGRGQAEVHPTYIDLFDDSIALDEPWLRIHNRRQHPEVLVGDLEASKRLYYHKFWRFGMAKSRITNIEDWTHDDVPIDALQNLSVPSLVSFTNAVRLLGAHLNDWNDQFGELVQGVHLSRNESADEPGQFVAHLVAHGNPIVMAERLLRAEIEAKLRICNSVVPLVREKRGIRPAGAGEPDALGQMVNVATMARIATFHATLMSKGHPYVDTDAMRERREAVRGRLDGAAKDILARTEPTAVGAMILEGVAACEKWAANIGHSTKGVAYVAKPKKILCINLDFQDANYSWLVQHTFCLRAGYRRHTVDVIAPHPTKAGTDVPCEMGLHDALFAPHVRREYLLESKELADAHATIQKALAAEEYDAIVANIWAPTLYFLLEESGKDLTSIPIVLYDRHLHHDLDTYGDTPERIALVKSHRLYLNCMQEPGSDGADRMKRRLVGFDFERVYEWPWSIDRAFFENEKARRKGRGKVPMKAKPEFKIFSGGDSKRDYPTLFEAVSDLDVELRVASSRDFGDIPDNISILGRIFLHEFRDEIRNCDAVVIPLGDGFGNDSGAAGITVFAIAFALGKPVICTDLRYTRRYITHGESGLLVPEANPEAMRKAITYLMEDEQGREALIEGAGKTVFYTADLADACLEQIDSDGLERVVMPKANVSDYQSPPSFGFLHQNYYDSWDMLRLSAIQEILRDRGYECEVIDTRTPVDHVSKTTLRQDELPDRERRQSLREELKDVNFVVADKCPTAFTYLKSVEESGDGLAANFLLSDYHMLGRVDLIQEAFNEEGSRMMLGKWWPSSKLQVMGCYPSFSELYRKAGIPQASTHWMPLPAQTTKLLPGERPSQCEQVFAGGLHMRDHELMCEVLPSLPEAYRHRIVYFGHDPGIDWEKTGITFNGPIQFSSFYKRLNKARFFISPLLSKDTSFGGISSADVCRSSGRPFVTTDIPPLRDALGVSNVILCRPGDAESLRAAIIRCFEDDDLVDRIYEESAVYCEANSIERYTDYFVNHALVWQTELD